MMTPPYLLIAIDANGRVRYSFTTTPKVPEGFVRFGEVAFVTQPLDVDAMPEHQA
jgi:hypothetical protein